MALQVGEIFQVRIKEYSNEIQNLFADLRKLIIHSVTCDVEERLWANLPSFYVGDKFVRLIPFKNHINIEATATIEHGEELEGFNITPKGMLQIFLNQDVPVKILSTIFYKTFLKP